MRIISNSEVMSLLSCERKHYYGYIMDLEPKSYSTSLTRGTIGHNIFMVYYRALAEGATAEQARKVATIYAEKILLEPGTDVEMVSQLISLINQYWLYNESDVDDWEILFVEEPWTMDLTERYAYGLKLDLLVKIKHGQYLGEKIVVDHKFVYNFKSQMDVNLNPQIPKYIAAARQLGHDVTRGMFNQLRYRHRKSSPYTNEERYNRHYTRPTQTKIRNIFAEQIKGAERVITRHEMDPDLVERNSLRTLNDMTCKNCMFQYLCDTQLAGEDVTLMVATEFQPNSYNATYQELAMQDA